MLVFLVMLNLVGFLLISINISVNYEEGDFIRWLLQQTEPLVKQHVLRASIALKYFCLISDKKWKFAEGSSCFWCLVV